MLRIDAAHVLPILAMISEDPILRAETFDENDACEDLPFMLSTYHPDETVRQAFEAFVTFQVSNASDVCRGPFTFDPDLDVGEPDDAGLAPGSWCSVSPW